MNRRILAVGFVPPPYNGISTATTYVNQLPYVSSYQVTLLDIGDRRGLNNVGKLDWRNCTLAIQHMLSFIFLLLKERPDIAYIPLAQNAMGFLRDCGFLVPAKLFRRKVVVHLHGGYFKKFYESASPIMRWIIRWTLRDVKSAVVLGYCLSDMFSGILPATRIRVVPNGVDPSLFKAVVQQPRNGNEVANVVYLGTICEAKGVVDLIKAVALVKERVPSLQCTLAGETIEAEEQLMAKTITTCGVQQFVDRCGVVTGAAKANLLTGASVFVFPTKYIYEGHPFVILEAMAAGLPVITTKQGATEEIVIDGVTGFIVPQGDPRALSEKITLLLSDHALRRRMGSAGQERFQREFTSAGWLNKMIAVFDQASKDI